MSWGNGVVKKLNQKVEKVWERYINVKLKKSHHNNNEKKDSLLPSLVSMCDRPLYIKHGLLQFVQNIYN